MGEPAGRIVLLRHGETSWSSAGRHTGLTDIPLTAAGEQRAVAAGGWLADVEVAHCWASPLQRAWRTAELAGLDPEPLPGLEERHYGNVEGLTTAQVRSATADPSWDVWDDELQGTPATSPPPDGYRGPGESLAQAAARASTVLDACRPLVDEGLVCALVSHSHLLRILAACWLGLPPHAGSHLVLDAGHLGELGRERSTPALLSWNLAPR